MIGVIRVVLAIVLFLLALLTVFPAPTYWAWEASVVANEWGHLLAIIAVLMILPGWHEGSGKVTVALAVLSMLLLVSPLARSHAIARNLPARMIEAFGNQEPRSAAGAAALATPVSIGTLFRKSPSPDVQKTTMTYVVRDGVPIVLDLYRRTNGATTAPLVIAVHGGSWRTGTRADLPALNSYLAARGYVVASPEYRFAPASPHPAASEDLDAAISFLESNAGRLGIDSTRIVLLGRSAGAQLALLSAYTRKDQNIRGVVSLYGPTDQKWGWEHPSNPRVYNSTITLEQFLNGDPSTQPGAYRTSSPLNFVGADSPPTLMIHGAVDPLVSVRQSERLDSALAAAHRPHLFIELPWATHGCDYVFNGPCGQISTYAIERFIAGVTR